MIFQQKQTQLRQVRQPVTFAPSTGGETPIPITYTATATDPLYGTLMSQPTPPIGGSTYSQTGGLLSLLETAEAERDFQQQVEVQRAVQKTIQAEQTQKDPLSFDLQQVVLYALIGLIVGYLIHPIIKSWIN